MNKQRKMKTILIVLVLLMALCIQVYQPVLAEEAVSAEEGTENPESKAADDNNLENETSEDEQIDGDLDESFAVISEDEMETNEGAEAVESAENNLEDEIENEPATLNGEQVAGDLDENSAISSEDEKTDVVSEKSGADKDMQETAPIQLMALLSKGVENNEEVEINETNFPDANFRESVKHYDTDNSGGLSKEELTAETAMFYENAGIVNFKGIEHFTALEYLFCKNNYQLTSLDVSNNTALKYLDCRDSGLTSLDVSNNTALEELWCLGNPLTSLDVSSCAALIKLFCWNTLLTSLDVSNNTALKELSCDGNQLTSLDVSKNTALEKLNCGNNPFTSLDISNNTVLKELMCNKNQLTSLDISQNTALQRLECNEGKLTSLDVSGNTTLKRLSCNKGELTIINARNCTALEDLNCRNNQLTSLDVNGCTALEDLNCRNNQLTSLDVSNCKALRRLRCHDNQLASLDVSGCTALESLVCNNNQLTSLDVSGCTKLKLLYCEKNQLTSLDLSDCTMLKYLTAFNQIPSTPLFSTLDNNAYKFDLSNLFDDEDKIANISDVRQFTDYGVIALPESASYDSATGILTVDAKEKIKTIIYLYDIKKVNSNEKISVIVNLTYGYDVTLNLNNGDPLIVIPMKEEITYALPEFDKNDFTVPTGMKFKAWEVNGVEKKPGDQIKITEQIEIKAIWESVPTEPEPIEPVEYKMLPETVVWTIGSDQPAVFTSDAEFADFLQVTVDDKVVDKADYEVKEGSTIVSFKPKFLATLSVGKHPVEIVSDKGRAKGVLEIKAQVTPESVKVTPTTQPTQSTETLPRTGENSGLYLWMVLVFLSASGLLYVARKKKYQNNRD
ncbi:MAG TPA: LPXTG cell wall anchor domain-containing protein [Clostridiaceae bacterium]|nr:LPXTG cell wall anchor domain-containing protein [Clostridiaceae bacterium]